jgi:hypothetical protein
MQRVLRALMRTCRADCLRNRKNRQAFRRITRHVNVTVPLHAAAVANVHVLMLRPPTQLHSGTADQAAPRGASLVLINSSGQEGARHIQSLQSWTTAALYSLL